VAPVTRQVAGLVGDLARGSGELDIILPVEQILARDYATYFVRIREVRLYDLQRTQTLARDTNWDKGCYKRWPTQ
jgi:hypothetical protein